MAISMEITSANDTAIQCVFSFKATPVNVEKMLKALSKLISQSRADAGCIQSDIHVSLSDLTVFFVHEIWQNHQALDAHTSSREFQIFLELTKPLLEEPLDVKVMRRIG